VLRLRRDLDLLLAFAREDRVELRLRDLREAPARVALEILLDRSGRAGDAHLVPERQLLLVSAVRLLLLAPARELRLVGALELLAPALLRGRLPLALGFRFLLQALGLFALGGDDLLLALALRCERRALALGLFARDLLQLRRRDEPEIVLERGA